MGTARTPNCKPQSANAAHRPACTGSFSFHLLGTLSRWTLPFFMCCFARSVWIFLFAYSATHACRGDIQSISSAPFQILFSVPCRPQSPLTVLLLTACIVSLPLFPLPSLLIHIVAFFSLCEQARTGQVLLLLFFLRFFFCFCTIYP